MITKDGRDTPIEKLTAENYLVPRGEEKDYHAVIEVVQFDQKTGKRISKPRVQKFGKKAFESHIQNSLRKQGYTVTILHDPNVWLNEQKAKRDAEAAKVAEEKAKAEQERFQAAVKAEVAKILAEEKAKAEQEKSEAKRDAEADKAPEEKETKKPGRPAKSE